MAEQIRHSRDLFGAEHPEVRLPQELASSIQVEGAADGASAAQSRESLEATVSELSLIHISEPTRLHKVSRMPSSA